MDLRAIKMLLLDLNMTVSDLARDLGCHRYSIYRALSSDTRPRVYKKLQRWYDQQKGRAA